MKSISRIIILICSLSIIPANYLSVWQIQLEAPQYPEGLKMEIWSHKIAGDINKINGLNHYIGMKQIHQDDFKEFLIMPYLIWMMVGLGLLTAITGKRKVLWVLIGFLVLCGLWGIVDFWQWEYHYGHTLDEHAAIKIPGMTYQPPLIGWKPLLNFLAGSFPDIGGWLVIIPAFFMTGILFLESRFNKLILK